MENKERGHAVFAKRVAKMLASKRLEVYETENKLLILRKKEGTSKSHICCESMSEFPKRISVRHELVVELKFCEIYTYFVNTLRDQKSEHKLKTLFETIRENKIDA